MSENIIPANFGRIVKRTFTDDNYTILPSDDYIVASVTGKVLTLPSAAAVPAGQVFTIGVTVNASVSTTVTPDGEDTIGGVAGDVTVTSTTGSVQLVSDGVDNWEGVRSGT